MSRWRVFWLCCVLAVAFPVVILIVPPPRALTRALAAYSSPWLMAGPAVHDTGFVANGKRVIGAYVQLALASEIADRISINAASDDEALFRITVAVRDKVMNQAQYDHIPRSWPVLVSGVGYCDQINGAVALIASHRFPRAQLFALYDRVNRTTPHTIGRVWSNQRRDWIYYDAFFSVPVLFTKAPNGEPRFLQPGSVKPIPSRGAPDLAVYKLPGWSLSDLQPTFGRYVIARASHAEAPAPAVTSTIAPMPTQLAVGAEQPPKDIININPAPVPLPVPQRVSNGVYQKVSREFVLARIDDLLGEPAKDEYRRIAEDPEAPLDERAADVAAIANRLADVE
jgi:hypothetical protein